MQFALFGLLAAILALKRPYLTLDLWVQRSPHEIGLSPAMWAGDRLNVGLLNRGGFFPRFNQFCHAPLLTLAISRAQPPRFEIRHRFLAGAPGWVHRSFAAGAVFLLQYLAANPVAKASAVARSAKHQRR